MNILLRAKIKILMRSLPTLCQHLLRDLMEDYERYEASSAKHIAELEKEMWYWKDRWYNDFYEDPKKL